MKKNTQLFNVKNIPLLLFLISFVILLIKSRYSFCWSDESFYQAVTSRFYNGDQIFYDEWFPTQLSSLLLLPLHAIYIAVAGNTDGIILFFRILFVILELVSALLTYTVISKHHGIFLGTVCALLAQWYTHLNIATLSYYTMSTHFFLMTMLLIYDCYLCYINPSPDAEIYTKKRCNIQLIISGVLFALCVLCLPTMCVAYFLIVFCGFLVTLLGKLIKNDGLITTFSKKLNFIYTFLYTLIGIVIPAIIFAIYMLTHVSISNFILSLTYVLSDDEHELSKLYPLKKMYLAIDESYGRISKLAYLFIALSFVVFMAMLLSRYLKEGKLKLMLNKYLPLIKPAMFAIDTILFALYLTKSFGHTGYIFTAVMLFSLPLFLLTEKKNWTLFILSFMGGLLFSLVYSYSSNGMLYLLSMGHFFCSLGGIIMICDFAKELNQADEGVTVNMLKTVAGYVITAVILICLIQTCLLRITNIYRDDRLSKLTEMTEVGPAKGLYTSKEHLEMYNNVYETISEYGMSTSGDMQNKSLLISKLLPYGYLISDLKVAAPTVWRNPMGSLRLKEYYELHEDRYPDVILVLDENYGTYETCGDVEYDPTPNENDSDGYMYDYIQKNNMKRIPVSCGVIYTK